MKYLVNRVTKEHFPYNGSRKHGEKAVENGDYSLYVIEADSEGWIPHTGTECPLPDDVRCDIKCVDEKASLQARNANQWSWNKTNCFTDITHYRPILTEAEPRPTAETYLNAAEKILESKRDKLYTKEGGKAEPSPDYDPRSVSFNLLKRLQAAHEAAQTIPDLEAQLRFSDFDIAEFCRQYETNLPVIAQEAFSQNVGPNRFERIALEYFGPHLTLPVINEWAAQNGAKFWWVA
jgi:hypothetical protein